MTKLIGLLFTVLAATIVDANQRISFTDHAALNIPEMNCLAGDVLNCVRTSGHHVYEKEMECPIGGESFKALFLGTHSTFGLHLDWEPVSYMRFPVPIPVCPSNGFVVTKDKYSNEELEKLKKVIESKAYKDIYVQKHATFYLYAKLKELGGEPDGDSWWLYLNATWEADNCKDKDRYRQYALETIAAAGRRRAKLKDSEELYWTLKLITAEMHRRIGDFKTAQELAEAFGTPALEDKDANEFFLLAKRLLLNAIKDKNTTRVPIQEIKESEK